MLRWGVYKLNFLGPFAAWLILHFLKTRHWWETTESWGQEWPPGAVVLLFLVLSFPPLVEWCKALSFHRDTREASVLLPGAQVPFLPLAWEWELLPAVISGLTGLSFSILAGFQHLFNQCPVLYLLCSKHLTWLLFFCLNHPFYWQESQGRKRCRDLLRVTWLGSNTVTAKFNFHALFLPVAISLGWTKKEMLLQMETYITVGFLTISENSVTYN